jgi:branched chain amino acid efflux pump
VSNAITTNPTLVLGSLLGMAAGTWAFRMAGPLLHSRMRIGTRTKALLEAGAVVLLTALVATTALYTEHDFAGFARPAGVLVGGVLAWRRAPFVAVVLAAAATTAALRVIGVR